MGVLIKVPESGKVRVRLPYSAENKAFIQPFRRGKVGKGYDVGTKSWEVDRNKWMGLLEACRKKYEEVEVWQTFLTTLNPGKKCNQACVGARYETIDHCTCCCEGLFHGDNQGLMETLVSEQGLVIVGKGTKALVTLYTCWANDKEVDRQIVRMEAL